MRRRMTQTGSALAVLVLALVLAVQPAAWANVDPGAGSGDVHVGVESGFQLAGVPGGGQCEVFEPDPLMQQQLTPEEIDQAIAAQGLAGGVGAAGGSAVAQYQALVYSIFGHRGEAGTYYNTTCGGVNNFLFIPAGNPVVSPAALVERAFNETRLTFPTIDSRPFPNKQLVGLATWLAIDPASWPPEVHATAATSYESATVTAYPISVTWAMGDGKTVTCNGPGSTTGPSCTYTYETVSPSGYQVTATINWKVDWQASGALLNATGTLGVRQTASAPVPFMVHQAQALNTT